MTQRPIDLARKQGYEDGFKAARREATVAIDEAIRIVAEHAGPERTIRLSAMTHIRAIVVARLWKTK